MQLEFFTRCQFCSDGIITDHAGGESPCQYCGGDGHINRHYINFGTNIFRSHTILEELDATEHNGLTDTQKDGVLHLLACGLVDLNEGKAGRVRLWNWFGSESTTVANLTAILE